MRDEPLLTSILDGTANHRTRSLRDMANGRKNSRLLQINGKHLHRIQAELGFTQHRAAASLRYLHDFAIRCGVPNGDYTTLSGARDDVERATEAWEQMCDEGRWSTKHTARVRGLLASIHGRRSVGVRERERESRSVPVRVASARLTGTGSGGPSHPAILCLGWW